MIDKGVEASPMPRIRGLRPSPSTLQSLPSPSRQCHQNPVLIAESRQLPRHSLNRQRKLRSSRKREMSSRRPTRLTSTRYVLPMLYLCFTNVFYTFCTRAGTPADAAVGETPKRSRWDQTPAHSRCPYDAHYHECSRYHAG